MSSKTTSLLLCFPTSSSTPSLAGAASLGEPGASRARSIGARLLTGVYFFFLLFANAALLGGGALLLSWNEMPAEQDFRNQIAQRRGQFISRFLHNSSIPASSLDDLLGLVQNAAQKGIITNFSDGNRHHNSVWSFGSAFLFLATVATTVGYGHAAPQTKFGKVFTIIYGIIAIPMLLAFFSELIRKFVALLNWIFVQTFVRHKSIIKSYSKDDYDSSVDVRIKFVFVLFISLILIASTLFVPAVMFTSLETRWTFLDGFYYTFISMTTVGLGDIIPGEGPEWNTKPDTKELYHLSIAVYLLSSLPMFFLAIKLLSSLVSTAEMTFRMPEDATFDDNSQYPHVRKPRIRIHRNTDTEKYSDDEEDDDETYDASSSLMAPSGRHVQVDSSTQLSELAEDSQQNLDTTQSVAAPPSSDLVSGSFSLLFPQKTLRK